MFKLGCGRHTSQHAADKSISITVGDTVWWVWLKAELLLYHTDTTKRFLVTNGSMCLQVIFCLTA